MKKLGDHICEAEQRLRGERSTWDSLWQEVSDYCWPEKAEFTVTLTSGVERNRGLLDSTAARALELFGSSMHNMLNNPNTRWFKVALAGMKNPSTRDRQAAEKTENDLLNFMSHPSARLYQNLHVNYLDLGAYGTSCLFTERVSRFLRTEEIHLKDYVFEEDAFGFPSVIFRQREYTYDQARQRFGKKALADENGNEPEQAVGFQHRKQHKVKFLHVQLPAAPQAYALAEKFSTRARKGANYVTVWVNTDTKMLFEERGEQTPPYLVARWYRNGSEKYGRSPAMTALPDIRMANRMMDTILRGAEKIVDPPWFVRDGSLMSPLRLFSGGMTFGDGDPPVPLVPPGASRIEMGNALLEQRQQAVREAFFIPLFATPDSPVKTARLDLDTLVPKADGTWTTMRDVQVGDVLVGSNGQPVTVTQVHPVVQSNEAWELQFHSGDTVVADDEHRWSVLRTNTKAWRTLTTRELVDDLHGAEGFANYRVPRPGKIDRPPVDLPIDPYVLGLWLGDGSSRDGVITTMDGEIADAVQAWAEGEGFSVVLRSKSDKDNKALDVSVRGPSKRWGDTMVARLEALGVRNNKHIPEAVFLGSHEQRLAVLQGLMDSDGSSNGRSSQVTFTQQVGRLAEDFVRLVESLGLYPRVCVLDRKPGQWAPSVYVAFSSPWPVFRLERKQAKVKPMQKNLTTQTVVAARQVENRPVRCITVDAEDHLYCVGRRFTVTSNTQVLQEVDERNRAISPMIVRVQEELHNALIARCYDLGVQAGMVEPLPDELLDQGVRVEYMSPIAASRYQLEALGTIRMFEGLALLAQIDPEVFDEFDAKKAANIIHLGSGAPHDLRRTESEKRALRAAREQEMQQAQALQTLQEGVVPAVEASAKMTAAQRRGG